MADALYRDPEYRAAMKRWEARMMQSTWTCRRCYQVIPAGNRRAWDLGHPDTGGGFEPEHRDCNRAAGARKGNASKAAATRWAL